LALASGVCFVPFLTSVLPIALSLSLFFHSGGGFRFAISLPTRLSVVHGLGHRAGMLRRLGGRLGELGLGLGEQGVQFGPPKRRLKGRFGSPHFPLSLPALEEQSRDDNEQLRVLMRNRQRGRRGSMVGTPALRSRVVSSLGGRATILSMPPDSRPIQLSHGSGSTATGPSGCLIAVPQRRAVRPDGSGSVLISSMWNELGFPALMAPSIASTVATSTTGSWPFRLMR
jgi:hypothetical protein